MDVTRREIFRGHFEECMKHLGASIASYMPKGSRDSAQVRKPVADFCGVTIDTIARWLSDSATPIGLQYIKLMCWLDLQGYRVIELEKMKKSRRNFMELVGYGLLSPEDAVDVLGYSNTSNLYPVLQGRQEASEDKDQKMWDIWKSRKDELETKKEQAQRLYRLEIPTTSARTEEKTKPAHRPIQSGRQKAVLHFMEGLLALLEDEPVERLMETAAKDFQQSAETVLRLSAHLSHLSSRLLSSQEREREGGG